MLSGWGRLPTSFQLTMEGHYLGRLTSKGKAKLKDPNFTGNFYVSGHRIYFKDGELHRESGPAITPCNEVCELNYPDERYVRSYFLNGIRFSKKNYFKKLLKMFKGSKKELRILSIILSDKSC